MAADLYFGHGEAWLGSRTAGGEVDDFDVDLPEINSLVITPGREKVEHISKRTEIAGKDLSVTRMVMMSGTLNVSTHTKELLELYLYGNIAAVAGGSFAANDNVFGDSTIINGQTLPLPNNLTHVSSLVLTDSAGSPATLVLNTDYEIVDADAGIVRFLDVSGLTQPFKAAGTQAAGSNVGILTQRLFEKHMRFKGINIADDDKVCIVDLYRCSFEPAAQWQLLNDGSDVNAYELNFEALIDSTKAVDATLGRYGRYRELT